jgi:PAS domain-containing protein
MTIAHAPNRRITTMPHSRDNFLAAAHDLFGTYLNADAVFAFDHLLARATTNPRQLKPPEPVPRRLPVRAGPPLAARPRPRPAVTYFRMNQRLEMIDAAPALLHLLEIDSADELLGSAWEQFVEDADELKGLWEQWMVAAQTHQGFTYTCTFHTATGRHLTLQQWVRPLRDHRTLALKGWFGCVQLVAKVIPIPPAPPRDELSA